MRIHILKSTDVFLRKLVALLSLVLLCSAPAVSKSKLYASGNDSGGNSLLYRLNVKTGAEKTVGVTGPLDMIYRSGLAHDDNCGILYASGATIASPFPSGNISALFIVDTKAGAATLVGNSGPNEVLYSGGLAYDSNHHLLFATGVSSYGVQLPSSLYVVNPNTGAATVVGPSGSGYRLEEGDLAYDASNDILYATGLYFFWQPLRFVYCKFHHRRGYTSWVSGT